MPRLLDSRAAFVLFVALACAGAFAALGWQALAAVHPAEDAYILFRYAENLAAGHGIVYNVGGPPAEGATDFLWLLLIAGGVWLGGDVATVALAGNALGAGIAGGVLAHFCWGPERRPALVRVLLCAALPAAVLAGGAPAAIWSFSSMLYAALVLWLFAVAVDARGRGVLWIPVLGVVVALFRPDGVTIGVPFALLGLWRAHEEGEWRAYCGVAAGCAAVGLAYALWRWSYFGLPVPLPLYVKQNAAGEGWAARLPGARANWVWIRDPLGPHWIVYALGAALIVGRGWRDARIRRAVVFLAPVGALLAALCFAVQTQNVEFRFQSPTHLVLLAALLVAAARIVDDPRLAHGRWVAAALVAAAAWPSTQAGADAVRERIGGAWTNYTMALAPRIGPCLGADARVALTEAGVVPYWTPARVLDVVGLNSPRAALRPPGVADLEAFDPDLVFLHQGTSLDADVLVPEERRRSAPTAHVVAPQRLEAALLPERRAAVDRAPESYDEIDLLNVQYAASLLIRFLAASDAYEIRSVDPSGHRSYLHVWAWKKDWPRAGLVERELRAMLDPAAYRSYLEVTSGATSACSSTAAMR